MKKSIISIILVLCTLVSVISFATLTASAATSGKVGNCEWSLDGTVLTIRGNGDMDGYFRSGNEWPWYKKNITQVIVEEGVTEIGMSAFYMCETLRSVTLPSTLLFIRGSAFEGCTSLESITIPESVTEIGSGAFMNCHKIRNIYIPKNVVMIGRQTFDYCYNLNDITVDENNKAYSSIDGVLFNKDKTILIRFPEDKGYQGDSYTVPDTVKEIKFHAFEGAINIYNFILPEGITNIESAAFYRTGAYWHSVGGGNIIFYIDEYLIDVIDRGKTTYKIKDGTKLIAGGAFTSCQWMKKIAIPDGVEYIGDSAFWDCRALKSISLPKSLKVIDSSVFEATALEKIYFRGTSAERNRIEISKLNDEMKNATWYFDACYGSENHSWSKTTVLTQATCSLEGLSEKTCQTCGAKSQEIIATTEHDYSIVSVIKTPTCLAVGLEELICNACGYKEERYVEPTGHVFSAWQEDIAPTCTEIGIMKRFCSLCNETEAQIVTAKGHNFDIFNVIKEATVTDEGYKAAACMDCGEIKTEIIPRNDVKGVISVWQGITIAIGILSLVAIATLLVVISRKNKQLKED